jgi:hypothetical protein
VHLLEEIICINRSWCSGLRHRVLLEVALTFQNSTLAPSSGWVCSHVLLYRQVRMIVVTQNGGKNRGRQTSRRSNEMAPWETERPKDWETAVLVVMTIKARWWRWNSVTELWQSVIYIRRLCCTWEWTLFLYFVVWMRDFHDLVKETLPSLGPKHLPFLSLCPCNMTACATETLVSTCKTT